MEENKGKNHLKDTKDWERPRENRLIIPWYISENDAIKRYVKKHGKINL